MPRYVRNTAVLAKIETVYKTDAAPSGAANALLISNLTINPYNASNVDRDNVRPFFGGSEQLVGTAYVDASFDVELSGSGTAGTAPAWGPLLRACAFAEVITAGTRVDYTPITAGVESVTIYWYDDGVLHKLLGARGNVVIKLGISGRPMLSFKFQGVYGGISAVASPGVTLTAWKPPLVITDGNTGDITFGCTHSPSGAPALAAGTVQASQGIEIDLGNSVQYTALLGGESIDITQRSMSGKVSLDLSAADEVSFMAGVIAASTQSLGLIHGTAAGNKLLVYAPAVQLFNPSKTEVNGRRLIGYDARLVPVSGNDELRIVMF
ncbi:MAG: hypothetical protein RR101_15015 [Burkholderiaceae bacterium]